MQRTGYCYWRQFKCHSPIGYRKAWWGQVFCKVSAHEKNGSAQQRPVYTCAHTYTFTIFIVLLFIFLSLHLPQYDFLLLIRMNLQATRCPYTFFHLVLLLTMHFMPLFLPPLVSVSFAAKPVFFFSLTFLH